MSPEQYIEFTRKLDRIDTALQGDPENGVLGIKQHIETLRKDFEEHTAHDHTQFGSLNEKVSRATWTFAGISLTITAIITVAGLIIAYYK